MKSGAFSNVSRLISYEIHACCVYILRGVGHLDDISNKSADRPFLFQKTALTATIEFLN